MNKKNLIIFYTILILLGVCFFVAVKSGLISKWKNPPAQEIQILKVFFNNSKLDPQVSCNRVFPVEREVEKTQAPARKALEMLLLGPTKNEKQNGYFTTISPGVKIQSLAIEQGIAKVDFNETLEFQVGGSCRLAAIRAEITQTLEQFSTVNNVIISINGKTEDILQP